MEGIGYQIQQRVWFHGINSSNYIKFDENQGKSIITTTENNTIESIDAESEEFD